MKATTTHGARLRRRQIHWQMLERLSRVIDIPALWWLRNIRTAVWLSAIACWFMSRRMDALLLFVIALILQLVIFQVVVTGVLREDGER